MTDPIVIDERRQAFRGQVYYRRATGYYQRWTNERPAEERCVEFLHRVVWEAANGPILRGRQFHVHHKDGNRANNALSNLDLIPAATHLKKHWDTPGRREQAREHLLTRVVPAARAWHSSEEGRAWHRVHARDVAEKLRARPPVMVACVVCAKEFDARKAGAECCSANCRATRMRQRRREGAPVDPNRQTVLRVAPKSKTCSDCGATFETKSGRTTRCGTCRERHGRVRAQAYYDANKAKWRGYAPKRAEPRPAAPCACGCGGMIAAADTRGRPRMYLKGHHRRKRTAPQ